MFTLPWLKQLSSSIQHPARWWNKRFCVWLLSFSYTGYIRGKFRAYLYLTIPTFSLNSICKCCLREGGKARPMLKVNPAKFGCSSSSTNILKRWKKNICFHGLTIFGLKDFSFICFEIHEAEINCDFYWRSATICLFARLELALNVQGLIVYLS